MIQTCNSRHQRLLPPANCRLAMQIGMDLTALNQRMALMGILSPATVELLQVILATSPQLHVGYCYVDTQ